MSMICTKKKMLERLSSVGENEKILFLFWEKAEFDRDIKGRELFNSEWEKILESVETDSADQLISDQITEQVGEIACEEEVLEKQIKRFHRRKKK